MIPVEGDCGRREVRCVGSIAGRVRGEEWWDARGWACGFRQVGSRVEGTDPAPPLRRRPSPRRGRVGMRGTRVSDVGSGGEGYGIGQLVLLCHIDTGEHLCY